MGRYIGRRLLLMIPTLWAIITLNFFIVQIAPGGPVDQAVAQMRGKAGIAALERISGQGTQEVAPSSGSTSTGGAQSPSLYRGARGLDPQTIEEIKKRFGFDKPLLTRYGEMLLRYATFDFGDSLFRGRSVIGLIMERMPISISIGFWSTLIIYLVSIPLGIRKAVRHGTRFDVWTSTAVVIGNTIPTFLFAIVLIIFFPAAPT